MGTQLQDESPLAKRMNSEADQPGWNHRANLNGVAASKGVPGHYFDSGVLKRSPEQRRSKPPGKCHSPVRPDVMQNTNLHPVAVYPGAGAEGLTGVNTHEQNFLCIHSSNFEPVLERRIGERPTIRNGGGSESDA